MKISCNGRQVKKLQLRGDEPEFNFAYGVFETIRTYYGQPFELPAHLRRLKQSATALGFKIAVSDQLLSQRIKQHCRSTQEQRLKIIAGPYNIYIVSQPLTINTALAHTGITVCTYASDRLDPSVKSLARIHEYMAHTYAVVHQHHDALLINAKKQIFEGAYSNIFMIKHGHVYTPDKNILFGVTRALVLKLAKQAGYPIHFGLLSLQKLQRADECFLTQTSCGIAPVVRVDRTRIAHGTVGPITTDLIQRFTAYVEKHHSTRRYS